MASANCLFTKIAGPFYDDIPGKKTYHARMGFQTGAGYDQADRPKVHGGTAGSRPIDVFSSAYIEQIDFWAAGSEAFNSVAEGQTGIGSGDAKAEFLVASQTVKLTNLGTSWSAGTGTAFSEAEMLTDTTGPNYPLTSMTFECKVVLGA